MGPAISTEPPAGRPKPLPEPVLILFSMRRWGMGRRTWRRCASSGVAFWAFIPCHFLGRQLRRNRQRADPSRCPISEFLRLMCPPLDRGARGVDNPKPVKVKMRVEREGGWDLTASARARRLRPLGRGAPLPVDTLNSKEAIVSAALSRTIDRFRCVR